MQWMPKRVMSCDHRPDSNWLPWSDVIVMRTPKWAIHQDRKVWVTASVVMLVRGMASGQRVNQFTHMSR